MSVTEKLMAAGQFNLTLNKETTPNNIINQIDAWGHIVIVPGDLNVQEFSDSTLLSSARYTGIVYSLEIGDESSVLINGQGLVAYLGDSDTRGMPIATSGGPSGVRAYKNKTLELTLDGTGTPKGILRSEAGEQGPIRKGTITEPTDNSTYTGKHYTESALKAIKYICQDLDVEFKISTTGYLDAGPASSLFSGHTTDPTAIIVRGQTGEDPNITGISTTSLIAQYDASEYVSRVELIASKYGKEANIGSASVSSFPYTDLFGNGLGRAQYISDPQTEGNKKTDRASAYLNELNTVKKQLNVSLDEYDISGDFVVGDKIFIFDPDIGFVDTEADRITDGRSSLFETVYQGQVLNPTKIRILGITWPIKSGYGVFYRKSDGSYLELTDYCLWEEGDVQLEIGDVAPSISEQLGFSGYTVDQTGSPDKSVPSAPSNLTTVAGTYSDGNGISKAFIKMTWQEPTNEDGSTITDGDQYRLRWRVVQDSDGNNIIDSNDNQVSEYVYSAVAFDTREFIIYDLSPNLYYEVGVAALDLSGFDSDFTTVSSVQTPADGGAPNKPDTFATIASNPLRVQFIHNLGQAKDSDGNAVSPVVNFTLAKDIHHLNIYASTTQGFDLSYNSTTKKVTNTGFKIGELVATSAHIQNSIAAVGYIDLDNADTHYFRVTAVDSSGNESEPSDEQSGNADLVNSQNIANLAVTNALIANAAITDLKVADVSAGKVTAGTISGQTIILDASGDTGNDSIIKSSNYSAGSTGWAITSDGTAEFRNATIRGSLNASDITAGTLSSDRLDTDFIAVGGAASDVNSGSTTIDGGNITTSSITTNQLNFTPYQDGEDIDSGTLGGITIDSDNIRTTNYSSSAGFRIESDGDAIFNDVTARGTISGTIDTSLVTGSSGTFKSSSGTSRVEVGGANPASLFFIKSSSTTGSIAAAADEFVIQSYTGDTLTLNAGVGQTDTLNLNAGTLAIKAGTDITTTSGTTLTISGSPGTAGQVLQSNANGISWEDGTGHTHGNLSFPNTGTVLSSNNHDHSTDFSNFANASDFLNHTGNNSNAHGINNKANNADLNNKANNSALNNKANSAEHSVLSSEFSSHVGDNNHGGLSNSHANNNNGGAHSMSGIAGLNLALAGKKGNSDLPNSHDNNEHNVTYAQTSYVNLSMNLHQNSSYHSDQRFKTDVDDIGFGLDFLKLVKPREFIYTPEYIDEYIYQEVDDQDYIDRVKKITSNKQQGFIAQELKDAVYEYTGTNNNFSGVQFEHFTKEEEEKYGDDPVGRIDATKLIPVLVKSVQELSEMVELLQARVDELEEI